MKRTFTMDSSVKTFDKLCPLASVSVAVVLVDYVTQTLVLKLLLHLFLYRILKVWFLNLQLNDQENSQVVLVFEP